MTMGILHYQLWELPWEFYTLNCGNYTWKMTYYLAQNHHTITYQPLGNYMENHYTFKRDLCPGTNHVKVDNIISLLGVYPIIDATWVWLDDLFFNGK